MELVSKQSASPSHIGYVSLTISDLETSIGFYHSVVGLHVLFKSKQSAILGTITEQPLVILTQEGSKLPKKANATGMDHLAILVSNRIELARHLGRIMVRDYPIRMVTDHGVNESLYLTDPDDNLIEITRDYTLEEIARHSPLHSQELMLQLQGLSRQLKSFEIKNVTKIGHILLRVSDLNLAKQFYTREVGFNVSMQLPGAVFVAAGDYHHHVGFHVWESENGPQPDITAIGLRYFSIMCESPCDFQFLRDPAGNGVVISSHRKLSNNQLIEFDQTFTN